MKRNFTGWIYENGKRVFIENGKRIKVMTKEHAIKKYNLKETGDSFRIARAVRETKTLRIVYDLYKAFEGDDVPYFMKIWRYRGDLPFGHSRTIEITE